MKIVIPTRSEGSLKIKFDKYVVRLAKILINPCYACADLGNRDPSLRIGMTAYALVAIKNIV